MFTVNIETEFAKVNLNIFFLTGLVNSTCGYMVE